MPPARTLVVCLPGGTFTKAYFHLDVPGYSFARHLARRGFVVAALDMLGTGESSRPDDGDALTFERLALVNDAVVQELRRRLRNGTLISGLDSMEDHACAGVGHSLGAAVAIVQQAGYRSFDAVAVLGYSPTVPSALYEPHPGEAGLSTKERREWIVGQNARTRPEAWGRRYVTFSRDETWEFLYGSDVPEQVVDADLAFETVVPRGAATDFALPGYVEAFAQRIDAPVLIAFGERDVSPDPAREPDFYPQSPRTALYVLAGSAHCHNLSASRQQLWDVIATWLADELL